MKFRITPLRPDFLEKVRKIGVDDQNQPVEIIDAVGGEPCRDVMRRAKPNEKIILASYCPFSKSGPYKEYGPIFVLRNQGDETFDDSNLPVPNREGNGYLGEQFVLKAYCEDEQIVDAMVVSSVNALDVLESFLSNNHVSFVIARYAAYGCYSFRVERAQSCSDIKKEKNHR